MSKEHLFERKSITLGTLSKKKSMLEKPQAASGSKKKWLPIISSYIQNIQASRNIARLANAAQYIITHSLRSTKRVASAKAGRGRQAGS